MNDDEVQHLISGEDRSGHGDHNGYRFCPRCGKDLVVSEVEDKVRPHCPACAFIYYRNPTPAAGAIIVNEGKILLVKRAVFPRRGDWCIPAGFMEWSEHPAQTAVRELKEETGLEVRVRSIFEIFFGMDDPRTHAVLILYLADIAGGTLAPSDDALDARFFDLEQLPPNIAFQAHRDALALYRKRFARG